MLGELVVRFLVGGLVVSAFAVLGDMLKPKHFAGLFGAAPSVATATLALTFGVSGGDYAGLEARSMLVGAAAFFVYSLVVTRLLLGEARLGSVLSAGLSWLVWLAIAFGLWVVALR